MLVEMNRNKRMAELKANGLSYGSIANVFDISRQRVHQILSGYAKNNKSAQHRKGWYAELKALVFERDGYKCQRCDSTKTILVHHQNTNDGDNNLSNLVTLCRKCHQNIHKPNSRR